MQLAKMVANALYQICILLYPYEVQTHMKSPPAFHGQMFTNYPILSPMGNALLMYFQL